MPIGPWSHLMDEERNPRLALAAQTIIGLFCFGLILPFFDLCSRMSVSAYDTPVIVLSSLTHWPFWVVVLPLGLLAVHWRKLAWEQFELHKSIRGMAFVLALVIAFAFATYPYNYFLDRSHYPDRLLLIALAFLVLKHPLFAIAFVLQGFIIVGQFQFPFSYSWTDKAPLFDLLVLLFPFLALKVVNPRQGFLPYLAAALCVVATFYFVPAMGKLQLDWVTGNEQKNIFIAATWQNNWLTAQGNAFLFKIQQHMGDVAFAIKIITIILEVGVIFILFNRRLAMVILIGLIGMHTGILLSSGIFFWKWVAMDLALIAILFLLPKDPDKRLFNPALTGLGAVLVLGLTAVYYRPPNLSWYDSNLCFHFHFEVEGESGEVYQLPPSSFAPYDIPFAQGRFYFLTRVPQIVTTLGATRNQGKLLALRETNNAYELTEARARLGTVYYNPTQIERFNTFVRKFLAWQVRPDRRERPLVKPPDHIQTRPQLTAGQEVYNGQEPVTRLRVRLLEALILDGRPELITDFVVHETYMDPSKQPTIAQVDRASLKSGSKANPLKKLIIRLTIIRDVFFKFTGLG